MQSVNLPANLSNETISEWFDKFISQISVDKMMMETNTAPVPTEQFYKDIINQNHDATNNFLRVQSTAYFLTKIVGDYFKELQSFKASPQKLAFDYSDAKILVWAQISNEDEATEDALILAEAKANSKYSDNGFYISSTIVEESDRLSVPHHYHEVRINGRLSSSH